MNDRTLLDYIQSGLYIGLGLIAVARWMRHPRPPEAWVAATFGVLSAVSLVGLFLPQGPDADINIWFIRFLIGVLILFPYFIFRFAGTFRKPSRSWELVASALTIAAIAGFMLIDELPEPEDVRPTSLLIWITIFLAQWVILSIFAAWHLLRGGRGLPRVARRRMQTLALGLIGFSVVLLTSGFAPQQSPDTPAWTEVMTRIISLSSAPLFLFGFAPPKSVLVLWRRPEEEALRRTVESLVAARSEAEIGGVLLRHAARLVGGSAAVLRDAAGKPVATFGSVAEIESAEPDDERIVTIVGESATLVVRIGSFAPFFGQEELQILRSLASLTDLALARVHMLDERQRMVQELSASNETLRDFVAIASHDLRTPVTVLNGFVQTLSLHWEHFDEVERREQLAAMMRATTHLGRLVEDLLAVSRIEAGAVQSYPQTIDLAPLVRTFVTDMSHDGSSVSVDIPEGLRVHADPDLVTRMLSNYLENAHIYGAPPVEVTATQSNGRVEVRVADHGHGVPPEFRPHLFDKFARADKKMSKARQGTGLGLSIVRGLARSSGGDAWFEERSDGACFVFSLPPGTVDAGAA